jgi:uncharacterized protein (TIGR02679 family)
MWAVTESSLEFLGVPRLRPLWSAVHRRLEDTGGRLSGAAVHLRDLSEDERTAVDRLLGWRSRGKTVRVELDKLDGLMQERVGLGLTAVVSSIVGPLRDRPGERAALSAADAVLWASQKAHPALCRHPNLEEWLVGLRRTGAWRRECVLDALNVLEHLPQPARRGRSNLAVRILGDAHALDDSSPVGRLVLSALASLDGTPTPLRATDRRRLWVDQGVIADETSSTVLTLGLRPMASGPLTSAASEWATAGVPLPLPLAAVQSERWRLPARTLVSVCENPSVLAAAVGTGATVVCVEGRPSVAATLLLESLVDGGARLRYHGDFGAGGISIANAIIGGMGASAWRFQAGDHALALDRARSSGTSLRPLRGVVPDAVWDPDLAPSVRGCGVEVEEELVIDLLVSDLAPGPRRPAD